MPRETSSSPDKPSVASRENSACSVDTVASSPGKDGKSRDKLKSRGDLKKLFSLPETEASSTSDSALILPVS